MGQQPAACAGGTGTGSSWGKGACKGPTTRAAWRARGLHPRPPAAPHPAPRPALPPAPARPRQVVRDRQVDCSLAELYFTSRATQEQLAAVQQHEALAALYSRWGRLGGGTWPLAAAVWSRRHRRRTAGVQACGWPCEA